MEEFIRMSNFEKRFGKYAIPNISLVLIICYAIGYVLETIAPALTAYLTLDPYQILFHGQIWRLVTWILLPPSTMNIFTLAIMMLFYYSIGTSLERTWGTYRYNVYLFGGMLFTIIGSFLAMGLCYLLYGSQLGMGAMAEVFFRQGSLMFSTYYINMSIFLAYAATFPEAQVLLMFIIPIKVKWLGIVYGVMLALEFVLGVGYPDLNIFYRIAIAASLLNFGVFWLSSRHHLAPRQIKRRQQFKSEVRRNAKITRHKCAICGRTEEDDPSLEFRFCSKCNGNYEYCQYHLFTHEHVK